MLFIPRRVGIFLSNELWHNELHSELLKRKNSEFEIWPLPAMEIVKARKVAHLLNELPLPTRRRNASVELRTDSMNRTAQFQNVLKSENLCFKTHSSADKILVYVGKADFMKSIRHSANESLIIVPLSIQEFVLTGEITTRNSFEISLKYLQLRILFYCRSFDNL